jgi:hypothetical protein
MRHYPWGYALRMDPLLSAASPVTWHAVPWLLCEQASERGDPPSLRLSALRDAPLRSPQWLRVEPLMLGRDGALRVTLDSAAPSPAGASGWVESIYFGKILPTLLDQLELALRIAHSTLQHAAQQQHGRRRF